MEGGHTKAFDAATINTLQFWWILKCVWSVPV